MPVLFSVDKNARKPYILKRGGPTEKLIADGQTGEIVQG
jgi:hypothetical protein